MTSLNNALGDDGDNAPASVHPRLLIAAKLLVDWLLLEKDEGEYPGLDANVLAESALAE